MPGCQCALCHRVQAWARPMAMLARQLLQALPGALLPAWQATVTAPHSECSAVHCLLLQQNCYAGHAYCFCAAMSIVGGFSCDHKTSSCSLPSNL